jgi:CCR4-NOT transcriptional regulation complex NOT5 subunit
MSIGRHARKRAAEQAEQASIKENRLLDQQEKELAKEEAKKGAMERDIESQRIATMRARFGGQVPQQTGGNPSTPTSTRQGIKNRTPTSLTGTSGKTGTQTDPMKQTIMSMMLGKDDGVM